MLLITVLKVQMQSTSKPPWKPYKIFIQSCTIFFSLFHQLLLTFPIPFHQHRNWIETKTNYALFGIQENSSQYIKLSGYSFLAKTWWWFFNQHEQFSYTENLDVPTPFPVIPVSDIWMSHIWMSRIGCPTLMLVTVSDTNVGHCIGDWNRCGTWHWWLVWMWGIALVTGTNVGHYIGDWNKCGTLCWWLE